MSQDGTWVFGFVGLEGDVVVGDAGVGVVGLGGGGSCAVWRWRIWSSRRLLRPSSARQKGQVVDQDFGFVFFWPEVLSSQEGFEASFDVEFIALLDVVADDLGGALEGDEIVPFGLIGELAILRLLMRSVVAMEKLATVMPPAVERISGSLPTLPSRMTLLTLFAMKNCSVWCCY